MQDIFVVLFHFPSYNFKIDHKYDCVYSPPCKYATKYDWIPFLYPLKHSWRESFEGKCKMQVTRKFLRYHQMFSLSLSLSFTKNCRIGFPTLLWHILTPFTFSTSFTSAPLVASVFARIWITGEKSGKSDSNEIKRTTWVTLLRLFPLITVVGRVLGREYNCILLASIILSIFWPTDLEEVWRIFFKNLKRKINNVSEWV